MKNRIIEHSKFKIVLSAFSILKRNGSIRLVIDYRNLNKITEKDNNPFLSVDINLRTIDKKKFLQIDMNYKYHQLLIGKEYQHLTSFILSFD